MLGSNWFALMYLLLKRFKVLAFQYSLMFTFVLVSMTFC